MSRRVDAGDAGRAPVTVLGAGSWGTALAIHLGRAGVPVRLWARDPALAASMGAHRENPRYLPGATLPDEVSVTPDAAQALADSRTGLVAVPSHFVDAVLAGVGVLALVAALVVALVPDAPAPEPSGFLAVTVDADTITLIGPVPDEATRNSLTAAAGGADRAVVDALMVDPAAGAVDPTALGRLLAALSAAPAGERSAVVGGSHLVLSGTVPDEQAHRAVLDGLALPGVTVDDQLRISAEPDPAAAGAARLSAAVTAVQTAGPIRFAPDQVTLGPRGDATVRAVAGLLTDLGDVTIEVAGYAAPTGTPGGDAQPISEQRAYAVRDALVAAGVDAEKITARGMADADPQETPDASRRVVITARAADRTGG